MQDQKQNTADMLAVFDKMEVSKEQEIPQEDIAFCILKQNQCHAVLNHLKSWHDRFRHEAENYSDQYDISYTPTGIVEFKNRDGQAPTSPNDFHRFCFQPFKIINDIVRNYQHACYFFGNEILGYFEKKYRFTVSHPQSDNTISIGFLPDYKTYVDLIINNLNGQTFREKAEEEIIKRTLLAAKPAVWSAPPECREKIIRFFDIIEIDSLQRSYGVHQLAYGTDALPNDICAGLVLYATGSIQGGIDSISGFNPYNMQPGKWYNMQMGEIEAIKFFVNGRIDVRFSTPSAAAECFHFLRLYSLVNH